MKENKLKLIKSLKDFKTIGESEINNIYNYERIVKYVKNLYNETGLTFKKQFKPKLILNNYSGKMIIHIVYNSKESLIINDYLVTGIMISENKKNLIIQLMNKDKEIFFTTEKCVSKYLRKRNILQNKEMKYLAEKICYKLNLDLIYVRYVEKEKMYMLKIYNDKEYKYEKIFIKDLHSFLNV